jgi:uncharacterized protein DUF1588/uncharacterized protein DUF1592/uncharacterized protein DUF1595/uncharacterized protein DUF1587
MRKPILICALLFATGCSGLITGGGAGGDDDDDDDDVVDPDEPRNVCTTGEADIPGPRVVRRMTSREFTTSIRTVFGLSASDWAGPTLPPDPAGRNGFTNNVDRLIVDDSYAEQLLITAKDIAEVVSTDPHVSQIAPCSNTGGVECARSFLDSYGRRLWHRPLTDEEKGRYLELFDSVASNNGLFTDWIFWATVGLVQSPNFVYRVELGNPDGGGYKLDGYEIATALAYNLTGGPPDDALLDLAASGGLDSQAGIEAAARSLALDDSGNARPAFRELFLRFTDQWLSLSSLANLQKSPELFPGFGPEVASAMKRETEDYIASIVFDQQGNLADLLTTPETYLNGTLADYYGYGPAGTGNGGNVQVERPEGWGVGILTQGSVLSVNANNVSTSPTKRGKLVRERMLCYDMPPPPPVVGDIQPPNPNQTTRQRYEEHTSNEACSGCHALMDSIGFSLEHLDAAGRYRATEGSFEIDDSGAINGFDHDILIQGPTELASELAALPETSACMGSFMASFAYGLDHHDTPCLASTLIASFQRGDIGIMDFYLQLSLANHFTHRVD